MVGGLIYRREAGSGAAKQAAADTGFPGYRWLWLLVYAGLPLESRQKRLACVDEDGTEMAAQEMRPQLNKPGPGHRH